MKKTLVLLSLLLSLARYEFVFAQTEAPATKMSVNDRLIKARAARADKRIGKAAGTVATQDGSSVTTQANQPSVQPGANPAQPTGKPQKATPARR